MFENLISIYNAFQQCKVKDPLYETLHLADLVLEGKLRKLDFSKLALSETELQCMAQKRQDGLPLEYIVGKAVFMDCLFHCTPNTLIPREETELLVSVALSCIEKMQRDRSELTVIDVGTGSGNISVSLALRTENVKIMAADICSEALDIAKRNVDEYNLQQRVDLYCGDLFAAFEGKVKEGQVDIVVCNPPYLPTSTVEKMDPGIADHEPKVALDAGTYGINIFRRLIAEALKLLKPEGVLMFEIGAGQDKLVTRLLQRNGGYQDVQYFDDGEQIRVISASKKEAMEP